MKKIYKVYEVNNLLKNVISEISLFQSITIKGEISNFKLYNQYAYFSLKDEYSIIKATCFQPLIVKKLNDFVKESNNNSLYVEVEGNINIYAPRGEYSINVSNISIKGKGNIYEELNKSRQKLQKLGLFNKKRPLPDVIEKIGIITSNSAAALQDMYNTISRRNKFCQIYLFPTVVQGENAVSSIIKSINNAQNYDLDVLIIARGGGSIEDLWAFNDEKVAYAIYNSKIVTISGVGHEIDITTIDYVVDNKAITPTAAAELATPITMIDFQEQLKNFKIEVDKNIAKLILDWKNKFSYLNYIINKHINSIYNDNIKNYKFQKYNLLHLQNNFFTKQLNYLNVYKTSNLNNLNKCLQNFYHTLAIYKNKIELLNPYNVLKKGYSIVYNDNNKVVKSTLDIQNSQSIKIQTYLDTIDVKIKFEDTNE